MTNRRMQSAGSGVFSRWPSRTACDHLRCDCAMKTTVCGGDDGVCVCVHHAKQHRRHWMTNSGSELPPFQRCPETACMSQYMLQRTLAVSYRSPQQWYPEAPLQQPSEPPSTPARSLLQPPKTEHQLRHWNEGVSHGQTRNDQRKCEQVCHLQLALTTSVSRAPPDCSGLMSELCWSRRFCSQLHGVPHSQQQTSPPARLPGRTLPSQQTFAVTR